jgi:hypothetical protein
MVAALIKAGLARDDGVGPGLELGFQSRSDGRCGIELFPQPAHTHFPVKKSKGPDAEPEMLNVDFIHMPPA